jgi:rhodanese-related sulfurtransferase
MMRLSLILLVSALAFFSCSNGQGNQKIPVEQFEKKLADTKDAILLDVRTPGEFNERHLNNATNIDYNGSDFEQRIASLDKTNPFLCIAFQAEEVLVQPICWHLRASKLYTIWKAEFWLGQMQENL